VVASLSGHVRWRPNISHHSGETGRQVLGAVEEGFDGANGGVTSGAQGYSLTVDAVLLGSITKHCVPSGIHGCHYE
jgi:hypothetical protein